MADDGITDYSIAKRKAASILGLPANARLPENAEVESGLRVYQRLFQEREQGERLAHLRQKAIDFMEIMQPFNPYLTGAVLDGTAGRGAGIDIQLFTDGAKAVEIFLLNRRIDYRASAPRSERVEAVLSIDDDDGVTINLVIHARQDERIVFRTRDGRIRPRARIEAVRRLQADASSCL
jgi:predicted nucleotidyltransferase